MQLEEIFQELVFKAFKNRKRSGCVDCQQVRSMDGNLLFFKLKLLIFRRWWQLWMKSKAIKQRYRMNLFFMVFRSFALLPNLIGNQCKVCMKAYWAYQNSGCIRVCRPTIASVFICFSPLFFWSLIFTSENCTKKIITCKKERLKRQLSVRLSNYIINISCSTYRSQQFNAPLSFMRCFQELNSERNSL